MATGKYNRNAGIENISSFANGMTEGNDVLKSYTGEAYGALNAGRDRAEAEIAGSGARSLDELSSYYNTARDDLSGGFNQARGDVNSSIDVFRPAYDAGNRAMTLRSDFLGTGGDGTASARALDTFRGSTGYRDMEAEGREGVLRSQNAAGVLAGGNTLDAITRLSSSLADRSAQGWLSNLGQDADRGMTAASGMAGGFRSLADLATQRASGMANLATTQGARVADTVNGTGRSMADLFVNDAGQRINLASGLGTALVNNQNQAFDRIATQRTDMANASAAAKNANQNLALGAAGLGVKLLTGFAGGGGLPKFGA